MSILNYFKRNSNALPEPSGTLSNVIPSRAIAAANKEVSNLVHTAPNLAQPGSSQPKQRRRRTKKNNVYSPQLRAEMGEAALKFGATAASRRYSAKLGTSISESTMRGLKKAYVLERNRKRRREENESPVTSLPPMKRGRPLILGKTLDDAVQEYILKLREGGCPVNTEIVRAAAKGLIQAMDRTRLAECGGPATLSVAWAKSLLHRMNFTKRRGSTKSGMTPNDLEKLRKTFLSEIVETVAMNDVPEDLIFNWDQTGINLVPGALWTMDKKGNKWIKIAGLQDKRQITAVICGSIIGEILPPQLIYGGKTAICHPQISFPHNWVISHSSNHWSNEETMLQHIRDVIVPFVDSTRQRLELPEDQPALAIFDHFKGQLTEAITTELEENFIHSVIIPPNCTGELQPMDIYVNKVVKSLLRSKFSEWYSDELTEIFINGDDDEPVDISSARMKCIGGRWLMEVIEHLQDNPHIVVNGFKHAGIHQALGILADENDLSPYSDRSYEYSDESESFDEDEMPDDVSTPLSVHDVYTDTETELSVIEISSSDEC